VAGWLKIALRSYAAAAGAGAAQLGTAGALSILTWATVPTPEQWRRQLTWLLFIFATAVLVGIAGGRRSIRAVRLAIANRRSESTGRHRARDVARRVGMAATRVHAAVFASLGAFTSFVLVWLPARATLPAADVRTLALAAGIGVGIGAVAALLSLAAPPVATTVATWVGAVWIFGLTSAGVTIATNGPAVTPRLGVLDAPHLIGSGEWWLGPGLMVVYAAFVTVAVAITARRLGARPFTIALSGLAGPGIVAAIYLTVGPGEGLLSAYVSALLAAVVGTGGALATVHVLRRRETARKPAPAPTAEATPTATTTTSQTVTSQTATSQPATSQTATTQAGAAQAATSPTPATSASTSAASSANPPPNPAWQYPAATQYSANPYPTNQYPRWSPTGETAASSTATVSAPAASPTATATTAAPTATATPSTTATSGPATTATSPAASTGTAAAASAGRSKRRGRAERQRASQATTVVRPEPLGPEPSPEETLPRTARPAQVVAVEPSRPSPDAEPERPMSRRERRRAAKLAAARAEEAARRAKQMAEEEKSIGKREREHIDWVKHLTSVPVDPTLLTRQK
jgi:hypothetical protein